MPKGNNNFPGLGQNLVDKADALQQGGAFGGSDSSISDLARAVSQLSGSGRFTTAQSNLSELEARALDQRRQEQRFYRDRKSAQDHADAIDRSKVKLLQDQINRERDLTKILEDRTKKGDVAAKNQLKNQATVRINLQNELKATREIINARTDANKKEYLALRQRADQYDDLTEAARRMNRELGEADKRHQGTFGYHLGNQRIPHRALQYYGNHRIQGSLPAAMGGEGFSASGLAIGGLALGVGMLAEGLIDQLVKAFTRNYQYQIQSSDVFKGVGGGTSALEFNNGMRHDLMRFGMESAEIANIAASVRPLVGQFAGGGAGFRTLMSQGVSLDRAFGDQAGTNVALLARLERVSGLSNTREEVSKFSASFSEAIGRSGLIGVEQEMSKGVMELVELTRKANIFGADPRMFVKMIADISSSTNAKNLKGIDAAEVVANISQGISNPQSPLGQLVAMMALRQTLASSQNQSTRALASNGAALLNLQAQGLGLTIGGENLGNNLLGNFIQVAKNISGMNRSNMTEAQKSFSTELGKQFLYRQYGISPQQAEELFKMTAANPELFSAKKGGAIEGFGLTNEAADSLLKPGAAKYLSFLAEAQKKYGTNQAAVNEANNRIKELLGGESGKVDEAIAATKGRSFQEQARAVYEASAAGPLTQADKDRGMVAEFYQKMEEITGKILQYIEGIARHFGVDYSDAKKRDDIGDIHGAAPSEKNADKVIDYFSKQTGKQPIDVKQLQGSTALDVMAKAVQATEGYYPGSRSYRDNNPGNLTGGSGDAGFEWDMNHLHKFRKYSSYEKGFEALKKDLLAKALEHPDYTILQIMDRYLGGKDPNNIKVTKEGNPFTKADAVAQALGVTANTKLRDIPLIMADESPKQTTKEAATNSTQNGNIKIDYTHTIQDQNNNVIARSSQSNIIKSNWQDLDIKKSYNGDQLK